MLKGEEPLRLYRLILIAASLVLIISGCATNKDKVRGRKFKKVIAPTDSHERCRKLNPGQEMKYSFKTTEPVDFNIHYHEDGDIYYQVSEEKLKRGKGTFVSKEKKIYCMEWTNHSYKPVRLKYRYGVRSEELARTTKKNQ
jgi:hypothetical protein